MKNLEEQEADTGQNPNPNESPSSAESPMKRTRQKKALESTESQSKSGSLTSTPKKMMESSDLEQPNGSKTIRPKRPKSPMPVPKLPPEENRETQALKRLKVNPETLGVTPQITPMIKSTVVGGLSTALEAMRFSTDDSEIRAFLKKYDSIPIGDREHLSWEAIALAAKVNPKHLLGSIQLAVQSYCWNKSRFIAISNHPDLMEKRIEYAKMVGGHKDRDAVEMAIGWLQGPKGPTFVGKQVAVFNGGNGPAKDDEGQVVESKVEVSDGFDDLFPSPNEVQDRLVPIRQRLLER